MLARVIGRGRFELRETEAGHAVLILNGTRAFAWLVFQTESVLVVREHVSPPDRLLTAGGFVLVDFEGGPADGAAHLFLQLGAGFSEFVLPDGLPTGPAPAARIVETDDVVAAGELWSHLAVPLREGTGIERVRCRPPPDPPASAASGPDPAA